MDAESGVPDVTRAIPVEEERERCLYDVLPEAESRRNIELVFAARVIVCLRSPGGWRSPSNPASPCPGVRRTKRHRLRC